MVSLTLTGAAPGPDKNYEREIVNDRLADDSPCEPAPRAERYRGEETGNLVPLATLWRALRVLSMIALAAAGGAALVAWIVLGAKLPADMVILGFCVAFAMIMFIGMPLMLASIQDAIEEH